MTTQEVANKLVELCRTGKWDEAQDQLYAENCVSIEPEGQGFPSRAEGIDAIKAKGEHWGASVQEFHGVEIDGPIVAGNHFSCNMKMDITYKGKERKKDAELCVFEVKDGKIVKEQFFYPVG